MIRDTWPGHFCCLQLTAKQPPVRWVLVDSRAWASPAKIQGWLRPAELPRGPTDRWAKMKVLFYAAELEVICYSIKANWYSCYGWGRANVETLRGSLWPGLQAAYITSQNPVPFPQQNCRGQDGKCNFIVSLKRELVLWIIACSQPHPFYRWVQWGSDKSNNLCRTTQQEVEDIGFEPFLYDPETWALCVVHVLPILALSPSLSSLGAKRGKFTVQLTCCKWD